MSHSNIVSSNELSIFEKMTKMAQEYRAINLSQGFPDFPADNLLIDCVTKAMLHGKNQYAPLAGVIELRTAIGKIIQQDLQVTVDVDNEITITPGGTYGIYNSIKSVVALGDEVIVLEPCYDSYIPNIEACGGTPVIVSLNEEDFTINWDRLKAAITPKTKAIIINNPHNPSGNTWKEVDFHNLSALVSETNIYIISDEVYNYLVFDNQKHLSILSFPALFERSFVIFSFGKSLHVTGWKVGYVVAPTLLTDKLRKSHQHITFSVATPLQYGIAEYLDIVELSIVTTNKLNEKRNLFIELIKETPLKIIKPSEGSYFQLVNYKDIAPQMDDQTFADYLTKEIGVASIPLSAFYHNHRSDSHWVRMCFAKQEKTLKKAAKLLQQL